MTPAGGRPGRAPPYDPDSFTAEQRRVHDLIASGPRGEVAGPLRVWLTNPGLAETAQALGQYARYDSVLPPHLSELAILVTARIWSSGFEWSTHAPIALAAGVPEDVVEAIAHGRVAILGDDEAQAVFDCAVELHRDRAISDAAYGRGLAALGDRGMVDLVGICGYYTLISMTINAFHVPDGEGPALPVLDLAPQEMFRA
jgi:4-carboxymuconolactone decarboxylase